MDFLNFLHHDLSIKILTSLEDPSDLVRFGAVSRSWQHFVIKNGLCKQLCLRMFPQLSRVDHVNELSGPARGHAEAGCSNFNEWEALKREHRVYAFLARGCLSFAIRECISEAIIASSTDNYPEESIDNTLEPRDRVARRASYWSSKGQKNPAVPETLTYRLCADLCVITEISIRPFRAYFQLGNPIYSANSVRFQMGHIKSSVDNLVSESFQDCGNEKFVWTYTSEEFMMAQENKLQTFKLPEPVLCIGGILQIELLGRVQKQEMDGLYYICVSHVEVMGRPLSPAFGIQMLEPSEKFMLEARSYTPPPPPVPEQASSASTLQMRVRDLEQIVNLLRENGGNLVDIIEYGYGWDLQGEESDEEDIDIQ
ncbi:F-box protein [Hibiscus syriacus]|uniref:F-box protein n=1 Tax=Hibiscus syriacus TaxID=106335 RepID=A0A6A3BZM3_HIBSY|nr:F-box protein At4g00755-like [Hibiscus syriacus]XP_039063652.1 F-box protein At4g00755-like [Hibiscus syriacus]XP_039063653.1 F-box protein At4g00755-like [Hibiscus syriacus]KAE8721301.1 F-box protein [Hibiscus syriacus]